MTMTPELLAHLGRAGLAALTALAISFVLTPLVRQVAVRLGLSAKPKEDRWGRRVVARWGGVGLFLGFLGAALIWVPVTRSMAVLLGGVTVVFGLGLVDDLRRLPPYGKLVAQLLIGCGMVIGGLRIELVDWAWFSIPLSVLWFVLIMNAFNLLDNMDGLAAGIGAIASGFCAVHAGLAHEWSIVMLNAILCGTCLGFLRYNFPPAKIYMGDSGSHFLGLSLATLSLIDPWSHSTQLLSVLAVPALLLAVPIFDTCFVTIQRLLNRQHPFVGGTDHISHRLAILGLSARQTLMALYGVSVCAGLLSIVTARLGPMTVTAIWLLAVTALVVCGLYLSDVKVNRVVETLEAPEPQRSAPVTFIETMLFHKRRLLEIVVDFLILSSVYALAYLLRFEGTLTGDLQQLIRQSLPLILVVKLACFAGCGLYRGVWRYVGLSDLLVLVRATVCGSLLSACVVLYLWRFEGYSRAVFVIDGMLTFFAVGGVRLAERLFDDWINRATVHGAPALIIGAGDTGARVLRTLKYDEHAARRVVCFLDDDVRKHGARIHGCSVVGGRAALAPAIQAHRIHEVLIAIADPPGELLQHVQLCCEPHGVTWKVVTAGITDAV